jgi:hypothetical protein
MGPEDWVRVSPTYRQVSEGTYTDRAWRQDYQNVLVSEIIDGVVPKVSKEIK